MDSNMHFNGKTCSKLKNPCKNQLEKLKTDLNCVVPPPAERDNILETVIKNERKGFSVNDLSIYRTPSGKYYCQSCNLTANSQAQFLLHSKSKKHKHKSKGASSKVK